MKQSRNTVAKTEILSLIEAAEEALSHAEIQSSLNGLCDRVTIYRVLSRLEKEGVIHKVVDIDGGVKYASCHDCSVNQDHRYDHLHFSCEKCKTVKCIEEVEPAFKLPKAYKVKSTNFTVSGICPDCA